MIYEATWAFCAVESMRHPWQQFRWGFLKRQRLCFRCYFWVHRGCLRYWIHASRVAAVSLMISASTGALFIVESMCHPWKQFRWGFLSRQRLCFRWWFLIPQELFALSNPCVTSGSSFVDDCLGHRGFLRCRIHASPVEAVSLRISKSTATRFLLIIYESTRAICAVESMRHPWKQFSLMISESTGAVSDVETMRPSWEQFRW